MKLLAAVQSNGFEGRDRKYLSWLGVKRKQFCASLQLYSGAAGAGWGGGINKPNMLMGLYMYEIYTH